MFRHFHRSFLTAVSLLLVLGTTLGAQIPDTIPADTIRNPLYRLSGLTIMVPRPVSTTGGASAVEVVLDSVLLRPAPTLEQALRSMPLVQIRRNSRGEAQPAIRGAEERQIAILMDGVPLTLGWDARTDLSVIPLTAAQKINMIRGLSSVLHGPNVLGGVIEIDVARGADRQQAPRPFQVDLGMDHTGARSVGVTGGSLLETSSGEWVVRGGAGHRATDGYTLPSGVGSMAGQDPSLLSRGSDLRLNTDEQRFDGFFSARYRSEEGRWLSLSTSGQTIERGVAPEAHVQDPRLWRYPKQNRLITAVSGGTGQRQTRWGEGDLEASIGLDLGATEIDEYASADYREITGGEDSDDFTLTLRVLGDHSLGSRGEVRGALTYGDINHDEVLDGVEANNYRQRIWSLGTETEWRLGALPLVPGTEGSRLTVGFAADGADTPETGDKPSLGSLWAWGGRMGLTALTTNQRVLFHGAVSRRTRFPALRELYSGALGRFEANPELEPEILTGGEMGLTIRGQWMNLQAVGFHQRLTDGIVRTSVVTAAGKKYKRINQDQVRSTGLELLGSGQLGRVGLSGDVTVQQVRGITAQGDEVELEYEPAIMGKISAQVPLPWNVQGTAGARFMGQQYCQNPEVGGLQAFDESKHLDLSLRRVFQLATGAFTRAEAVLHMDNATDSVILDQCGLPQPGRTFSLHLRLW